MTRLTGVAAAALLLMTCRHEARAQNRSEAVQEVEAHLDNLHELASTGDFDAYFALYTDDAIFMGTDATERWTIADFKEYARPAFADGHGWTYYMTSRNVFLSEDGDTAWFDEMLENENLGLTRGTGVLVRQGGAWRIVQYNLTIPVPNQLAREFVGRIRSLPSEQ